MMERQISISGMTCANCVRHVRTALAAVPGVRDVRVDLATESATLELERTVDTASLRAALEAAEYGMR